MEPFIEPGQRSGYLKFFAVVLIVAYFVPAIWGMVLGFLIVLLVAGVPVFVGRWLVGKWFAKNRDVREQHVEAVGDPDGGELPWWLDERRNARIMRN